MGTCYYGICQDCKQYIDLDKFYSWGAIPDGGGVQQIDKEDLESFRESNYIYCSLRLMTFLKAHQGHKTEVQDEHAFEERFESYAEVMHWPVGLDSQDDEIDWRDPKAGRLIIKTRFGDIFLDYQGDEINCFRFVNGKRVDTVLLTGSEG